MQIKQNANRAASLVRHLLAFSRKQTLRPQVLDLGEVLSDLTMLLRRLIGEKVMLDVVHGRDLWPVKVDISQFEQVIMNLAVNARDAMPERRQADAAQRQCDGQGMRALPQPRACRRPITRWSKSATPAPAFRRRSATRFSIRSSRPRRSARAPALACQRFMASSNRPAASSISNRLKARGTTFRIFLPRHVADAREQAAKRPPNRRAEAPAISDALVAADQVKRAAASVDLTGHGTILLVEDEEGLRALNARGLASRGYTVLEAGNGVEAIEVMEKSDRPVDLVVSDVVMPEMDGPTIAAGIARPQSWPEDHFRVRLCRGRVPEKSAGSRPVRIPA